MSGARNSYTLRTVTLPLMLPMLLATWMYSFIGTLDDFETPLLVGLPAQIYLLPTVIYFTAYLSQSWGLAAAYATIFLLISVLLVVLYHRVVLRRTIDRVSLLYGPEHPSVVGLEQVLASFPGLAPYYERLGIDTGAGSPAGSAASTQ